MKRLTAWIRDRIEARRNAHLVGCCKCGRKIVRYVYVWNWHGRTYFDDSYCTACGAPEGHIPWVDYGTDVEITIGAVEDHIAGRRNCALPTCHANVRRHTHAVPKAS